MSQTCPLVSPVHSFGAAEGHCRFGCDAPVAGPDGSVYGVTREIAYGDSTSTLYKVDSGGSYHSLFSFDSGEFGPFTAHPFAVAPDGVVYGISRTGGPMAGGFVYRLVEAGPASPSQSIGFGPILWRRQNGETEYALSAIPLGGYVKMLGEDADGDEPVPEEERHRAFSAQGPLRRAAIIFAGPATNFVFAFIVYALVFGSVGAPVPSNEPRLGGVSASTPADPSTNLRASSSAGGAPSPSDNASALTSRGGSDPSSPVSPASTPGVKKRRMRSPRAVSRMSGAAAMKLASPVNSASPASSSNVIARLHETATDS